MVVCLTLASSLVVTFPLPRHSSTVLLVVPPLCLSLSVRAWRGLIGESVVGLLYNA
jgi:hypothetical protein